MLFISYICYGGSYPRPKGRELATTYFSIREAISHSFAVASASVKNFVFTCHTVNTKIAIFGISTRR